MSFGSGPHHVTSPLGVALKWCRFGWIGVLVQTIPDPLIRHFALPEPFPPYGGWEQGTGRVDRELCSPPVGLWRSGFLSS